MFCARSPPTLRPPNAHLHCWTDFIHTDRYIVVRSLIKSHKHTPTHTHSANVSIQRQRDIVVRSLIKSHKNTHTLTKLSKNHHLHTSIWTNIETNAPHQDAALFELTNQCFKRGEHRLTQVRCSSYKSNLSAIQHMGVFKHISVTVTLYEVYIHSL